MKLFEKNTISLVCVILLVLSLGLFYYSKHITFHGFKVFIPELALLICVIVGAARFLTSGAPIDKKYLFLSLLILGLMVVSSILSIKPAVSLKETLRWGGMFAAFFLALGFPWRAKEVRAILTVIVLMGLFQALWGLKLLNTTGSTSGLITRHFDNSNLMALYLDFSFPLILSFLISAKDSLWRIWWVYCLALIGLSLFFTRSRGSWVSQAVILFFFSLLFLYHKTGKAGFLRLLKGTASTACAGLFLIFFSSLILVVFAPGLTETLLKKTEATGFREFASRFYIYVIGFQIIEDFPLMGIGGNLYKEAAPHYIPLYTPHHFAETLKTFHLHNLFLKIAAENGLSTLLAFFLFLYSVGKDVFSSLLRLKGERFWLLAGAAGSAAAWLLHNLVDEGFSLMAIQLGILLGLSASMKRNDEE